VRPSDAAPTGNSNAAVVDTSATIRTQKAQQMAAASAVAQGRQPGAPVIVCIKKNKKDHKKCTNQLSLFVTLN
jgi:hypothetical protein